MQSAQYRNATSELDVLANMSSDFSAAAGWAPGTLPYKPATLPEQDGILLDYRFNDMPLPADEHCCESVSGVRQDVSPFQQNCQDLLPQNTYVN